MGLRVRLLDSTVAPGPFRVAVCVGTLPHTLHHAEGPHSVPLPLSCVWWWACPGCYGSRGWNTCVPVSAWMSVFDSLGYITRSRVAGSYGSSVTSGTTALLSTAAEPSSILPAAHGSASLRARERSPWPVFQLQPPVWQSGGEVLSPYGFGLHFLRTNDASIFLFF